MSHTQRSSIQPFSIDDVLGQHQLKHFISDAASIENVSKQADRTQTYVKEVSGLLTTHSAALKERVKQSSERQGQAFSEVAKAFAENTSPTQFTDYMTDFFQRSVLFFDVMRKRGNQFIAHEQQGCPPVLAYDYELLIDGASLPNPVNYSLVRIRPPAGIEIDDKLRPYVIIDPRAGHGSGIGGFKSESEVGVALNAGHPVYFCIFKTHPEPGQTVAHVTRAEAAFVREVRRRHPDSEKPVVIGNCQGGWATLLLAATNPDLTGPIVVNGAPVSYWSGTRGKNPMRYFGGLYGGVAPVMMMADLGNGEFDGANLVENFEKLNPGGNYVKKYYDVFANPDGESARYLEFENWWSGFYFMTADEIEWIVANLFVGNKLARGGVQLDSRLHADLRNIRAPIIVFASHGDNITPPQQALNWIADIYSDVREIKARGQKIVYTVHDTVGHLGIFVSASVAGKHHKEIVTTLQAIEAMAPGLYEMKILNESEVGNTKQFEVSFEERSIDDILALDDDRNDEKAFAAVDRISRINAEMYKLTLRPMIRAMTTPASAKRRVDQNPLRLRRYALSDKNPLLAQLSPMADMVRANRHKVADNNPFLAMESAMVGALHNAFDLYRDVRDSLFETSFNLIYGAPQMRTLGATEPGRISDHPPTDMRAFGEVARALENIDQGGYPDAVIRMLILLAHARKGVRRDRLERSNELLNLHEPFAALGSATRSQIIHTQGLIVEFEPEQALATLSLLLRDDQDRLRALEQCEFVLGSPDEMNEESADMLAAIKDVLEIKPPPAAKNRARRAASGAPSDATHPAP